MKNFCIFAFLTLFVVSCNKQPALDYDSFNEFHLVWNEIFDADMEEYFVYFYSTSCLHCQSIKKKVFGFANKLEDKIYFVKESKSFNYDYDIEKTIGVSSSSDFYIRGVPTLIEITHHMVALHLIGETQIIGYIDNYSL